MAVTETTTQSWGSRLGDSMKSVIFGLGLFVAAFPVLFWNEGNSVKTAKALDEGEGACVPVEQITKVDPEYEGQLVHMSGQATTKDVLSDEAFGVSLPAIALKRTTEMYQWIEDKKTEEKKNVGGSVTKTTTYTYRQDWSSEAISSSGFKEAGHDNPGSIEFPSQETRAANVTFGAFRLNEKQIARIGSAQAYAFPTDWVCRVERVQRQGNLLLVPNRETRANALNNRDVSAQPRIGDMRVKIEVILPHAISIVAKQKGDTFVSYLAKTKKKVDLLQDGTVDAAEMFEAARSANTFLTWCVRIGGFLMMFIGLGMVLKPLSVLADVLPFLGDLVEMGNGIIAGLVSFVCSLVTIAIAWVFYRPVLGIILLALAGGGIFLLVQKRRKVVAAKAASAKAVALVLTACFVTAGAFAAQCEGKTKAGARCKREAAVGSAYCPGHADQAKPAATKLKDDGTCWAVTEKGTRCQHKKDGESDYCKMHAADKKPAKAVKQCRALKWDGKQCERAPEAECYYCKQHRKLGATAAAPAAAPAAEKKASSTKAKAR